MPTCREEIADIIQQQLNTRHIQSQSRWLWY